MGDGCDDKKTHLVESVVYSTAVFRKEECIRKNVLGQNLTSDSPWSAMSAIIAEGHQEVPRCLSDYITGRSWSIFFYWLCHLPLLRICSYLCTLVWSIHRLLTILCPNFVKAAILLFISVYYLSLQSGGMEHLETWSHSLMCFDCVNVNLLSTIISQIWHFLLVETKNDTKLTNKYEIKSTGL